jgi:hypothetical protein
LDFSQKQIEFFKNGFSQGIKSISIPENPLNFAISRDPLVDILDFEPFNSSNWKTWGFLGNNDVLVSENTIKNQSSKNIPITVFSSIRLKRNVNYFEVSLKQCTDTSKIEIGFVEKAYVWDRSYFSQNHYGYVTEMN